jgi:hypothetical protein
MKKRKTYIYVIAGVLIGFLLLALFIIINYYGIDEDERVKIPFIEKYVQKNEKKKIIQVYIDHGFECDEHNCYKTKIRDNGVQDNYQIFLDENYIILYFQVALDDPGSYANANVVYYFNKGTTSSTLVLMVNNTPYDTIEYKSNTNTGQTTCSHDIEKCVFNISVTNDLINYYASMFE